MAAASEETGWDRVKSVFDLRRHHRTVPEEIQTISQTVLVTSLGGLVLGGLIGARKAGDQFIIMHSNSKFSSVMQAQRELHSSTIFGFVRHGCRWGWKMGLFTGIFSGILNLCTVYRDKDDALNYVAAGAVAGGCSRVLYGVKPAIGGTVIGVLLSLPFGLVMQGLSYALVGKEKLKEMRREAADKRRLEWDQQQANTSVVISDLEKELVSLSDQSPSQDVRGLH